MVDDGTRGSRSRDAGRGAAEFSQFRWGYKSPRKVMEFATHNLYV